MGGRVKLPVLVGFFNSVFLQGKTQAKTHTLTTHKKNNKCFGLGILLMAEILHHLGSIKPCKYWEKLPINRVVDLALNQAAKPWKAIFRSIGTICGFVPGHV